MSTLNCSEEVYLVETLSNYTLTPNEDLVVVVVRQMLLQLHIELLVKKHCRLRLPWMA